ncbi:B-cell receptor CD22-like [Colossoma macropomum]|uniref:B-cell receptor CD22-like n=1 Tax=Colossoma macropomum TaxID=42526 RepID=UPI0018646488|nr:B-cell receptor CD22-like [Colossoma macropomum]
MIFKNQQCLKGEGVMISRTSGNITAAVILILLTGVQAQHSVTLSSQSLCAVTGSTVKISCKYTTADSSRVREREWYQLQSSDGEERVLTKDPQYSARVSVSTWWNDCDLTVRDVRVRDSGVYNFRFRTSSSDWISASSGVNLTVTELQVKVDRETAGERKVKVICSSTCSLDANLNYDWYRNEVYKAYTDDAFIVLDSTRSSDEGSYSCQVEDSSGKRHHSPSVCVLGKECWGVTYTPECVCALKGSSVDLSCSYNPGGQTVTKSVWFIKEQAGAEPVDVREDEEYQGRVQYRQSSQNDFLKVTVSDTDSGGKKLMCSSTCTLPDNLTYIWYKNGQLVIHCKSASCSVAVVSGAVSYSCAVEGHESLVSPPVYSPRNTRAVVVSSGERVEGESVTLSCSSDADPPVLIYSWFKQRAAADAPLTTGQNYTITNISSQHSGLYYCTAHNQLGLHSSTPTRLDVLHSAELWKLNAVWGAVGVVPVLALSLLTAVLCIKRKRGAERDSDIQTPDPADHTYTALNPTIMTSDHDTLQIYSGSSCRSERRERGR